MATKLNMAKFLRESIAESAVSAGPRAEAAQELSTFFKKVLRSLMGFSPSID